MKPWQQHTLVVGVGLVALGSAALSLGTSMGEHPAQGGTEWAVQAAPRPTAARSTRPRPSPRRMG